jgi:hypothetical protein
LMDVDPKIGSIVEREAYPMLVSALSLWVISGRSAMSASRPLYRTSCFRLSQPARAS